MHTLVSDARHALRLLSSQRGFAAAVLLTIALGVSGTTAVFAFVYGVLIRPLPYPQHDRLVRLHELHPGAVAPIPGARLSGPTYRAWSSSAGTLESIGAFGGRDYTLTIGDVAERRRGTRVTPGVFRVLGASPAVGRFFSDTDAFDGAAPVVVLSHGLWRDRFGASSDAIGRTLTIDGVDHQVVGIAPAGFSFPDRLVGLRDDRQEVSLYTPLNVRPRPGATAIDYTDAIARLGPGVSLEQAAAEGTSLARSVDRPNADLVFGKGQPVEVHVRSLTDDMTIAVRPALGVLSAGVGLVLLIACANVAHLFLSRGRVRVREMAVRSALGASRARLVRQLVTESMVVALIGGALGACIGIACTAAAVRLAPADFPRLDQIRIDRSFAMIAMAAAGVVAALAGLVPAIRGARVDLSGSLQSGSRTATPAGRRLRHVLLAVEAALAVVLLIGAALLARSFAELLDVDAGYDASGVLTADVRMPAGSTSARTSQLTDAVLERVRGLPGVRAAGAGDMAPFGSMISSFGFRLGDTTGPDGRPATATSLRSIVTPGYAEALGMRLVEGRLFRVGDRAAAVRPMLVSQTFARRYLRDGRPITGRRFPGLFPNWLGRNTNVEIAGVVEDVLPADLDARPQPQIFVAEGGGAQLEHVTLIVKTDASPEPVIPLIRETVRRLEPGATVERVGPLAVKVAASFAGRRFTTTVVVVFAALALTLAAIGLYGVLSYDVAERRREIGVRTALGATRGDILRMIVGDGMTPTTMGLAAGMFGAALLTRTMAGALFGVSPLDAVAFSTAPLILIAIATIACILPARRALAIDPAQALRGGSD